MEDMFELYKKYSYEDLEECLKHSKTKDEEVFYSILLNFNLENNK